MKTDLCPTHHRPSHLFLLVSLATSLALAGCSDDNVATTLPDAAIPITTTDAAASSKDSPVADAPVAVDAATTTNDAPVAMDTATTEAGLAMDALAADGGDAMGDTITVAGTWLSNFGGTETISNQEWSDAILVEFDNANNLAYTQNALTATYGPGKFNKLVWTPIVGSSFYFCFVDYSLDSLAAAKATTKVADATNPDKSGCGGFSWTKLTKL